MAFELWRSPNYGTQRKGTTFKELKSIFTNEITVKYIFEPIYSCSKTDDSTEVKAELRNRGFDVVGIRDEQELVVGYAESTQLEEGPVNNYLKNVEDDQYIPETAPVLNLFNKLASSSFIFIKVNDKVEGIITRADINKPLVRIYIFGIISLFEMHLNFWINEMYKDECWINILNKCRIKMAKKIFKLRKGNNVELTLLECIQLCDKKEILKSTYKFMKLIGLSNNKFDTLLENIEKIRNELAHSQNSIISNLKWKDFLETISEAEEFLAKSEKEVQLTVFDNKI